MNAIAEMEAALAGVLEASAVVARLARGFEEREAARSREPARKPPPVDADAERETAELVRRDMDEVEAEVNRARLEAEPTTAGPFKRPRAMV